MGYLMWNNLTSASSLTKEMIASGKTMANDVALQRTRDTLVYFAGGVDLTSVMVAGMLRSPIILKWSTGWGGLLVTLPARFFCLYQLYTSPPTPQNSLT